MLADVYAEKGGFYCYVPDFHSGDSLPVSLLQNIEPPLAKQETLSFFDKAKNGMIVPVTLGPWYAKSETISAALDFLILCRLLSHRESVTRPIIEGFVNAVRLVPGTDKVGCIGFCWGGRYTILNCRQNGVDAGYACHPSLLAVPGDFSDVSKPLSIALGTKDSLVDAGTRGKIKDALSKKSVASEVKEYPDQVCRMDKA